MAGTCSKKVTQPSLKWTFKIHHLMQLWKVSSCAISFPSFLYLSFSFLNPSLHFKLVTRNKEKGGLRGWNRFSVTGRCFFFLCMSLNEALENDMVSLKWICYGQRPLGDGGRFLGDGWEQTSESQRTEITIYFSAWRINICLHLLPAALNQWA